jgi:hypothetical protein
MTEPKQRRTYDRALLDEVLARDGATLIGEYAKITRDTKIKFTCKCNKQYEKGMRYIVEDAGALCKECTMKHMVETQKNTMTVTYGVSSPMHVPEFKAKQEQTMLDTYGVTHNSYNLDTIQKRKDTIKEHFGVEHHFQLPEKIEERRQNSIKKRGVPHHLQTEESLEKLRNTNIERRGVPYVLQSADAQQKARATNLERYGTEIAAQSPEIQEKTQKNAKKFKEYKMPSGAIRKVQGYEPFALNELLKTYTEEQIKTERKEVPHIQYEVDGKKRIYFPDIFLPHENKIIEVKSTWTFKCKTDNIELKKKATEEKGYVYELWCFDAKGNRVSV